MLIEPKFAPAVKTVFEDCGTYLNSTNIENTEHELEYFVEQLINNICEDLENEGVDGLRETLQMMGYIKPK